MSDLVPFNRKRSDLFSPSFEDFYNMIDDFFTEGWPFRRSLAGDTFKVDVLDKEKEYIVEAELPGVHRDEINLSFDEGRLSISITKEEDNQEESKNYIHRERRYSSMSRKIFLADADSEGIKAKLEDGVLTLTIPKKEKPDNSINIEIE